MYESTFFVINYCIYVFKYYTNVMNETKKKKKSLMEI